MQVLVFVGYERLFDNKMESKKYNTWNKSKSNIKIIDRGKTDSCNTQIHDR